MFEMMVESKEIKQNVRKKTVQLHPSGSSLTNQFTDSSRRLVQKRECPAVMAVRMGAVLCRVLVRNEQIDPRTKAKDVVKKLPLSEEETVTPKETLKSPIVVCKQRRGDKDLLFLEIKLKWNCSAI